MKDSTWFQLDVSSMTVIDLLGNFLVNLLVKVGMTPGIPALGKYPREFEAAAVVGLQGE